MSELTPLATIAAFDEATRTTLAQYWITTAEEFASTVRSGNTQFGTGLAALGAVLDADEGQVRVLFDAAQAALPPDALPSFSIAAEFDAGTGAIFDDLPSIDATAFATPVDLPDAVDPIAALPPPERQGTRNACVAFALAALYQIASGDTTNLSEQFLYWACKEHDGIPGDVGTNPAVGMAMLRDLGICTEATWPYDDTSNQQNPGQGPPPTGAQDEAHRRRITGFTQLPNRDIQQIRGAVADGKAVMIGLFIWEHWTDAWQAKTLGRVRKSLPGERRKGGHALSVVGYRDDATAPGNGYFIVRNSWGTGWGTDNPDGAGHCHIPYKLVFEECLAAFVVDGVAANASPTIDEPASMTPPVAVEPPTTSEPPPNTGSSEPPRSEMQAIYRDLLALQQQTNRLVEQVATLLPGTAVVGASPVVVPPAPVAADQPMPEPTPTVGAMHHDGPLVFIAEADPAQRTNIVPNGIDGTTGQPLLQIDALAASTMAQAHPDPRSLQQLHNKKLEQQAGQFGTVFGVEMASIEQSRWAVVVNANDDAAILKALSPLIRHRSEQQGITKRDLDFQDGESCGAWLGRHVADDTLWAERPPVLVYRPDETANAWLARHGVAPGPVDPTRGVPFYLMVVGRPGPLQPDDTTFIPFLFQYELDIFWGVGRLCFAGADGHHRLEDYTTYAERVVAWEQAAAADKLRKEVVYFGTRHELDDATIRSADELINPLAAWHANPDKVPTKQGFTSQLLLGENAATRANLEAVLRGGDTGTPPAVLFTATHGLGLPADDPRLVSEQGALVCQDWTGFGSIKREHWFAGSDLSAQTNVEGMVAFLFACYGAGCPQQDEFVFDEQRGRPIIAPFTFVSQFPQQLLLHGALAVLGHVERAWTYSFSGTAGAQSQTQGFEDVLGRLLAGQRLGAATDQFNVIQGDRAAQLANELENVKFGKRVAPINLARLWMARNDARNYAVIGDPAVRLPFGT